MKSNKRLAILLVLIMCVFNLTTTASASSIAPFKNTIFGSYSVYLPSTMIAEFQVTTRKVVPSISISATMQVKKNGVWSNYSTGVYPSFSESNQIGWDTTGDYSSACAKGYTYRLVVTYSSSGTSVSYTSNERAY